MKKLVIEREEWLRGEGSNNSYLLRVYDGMKCCLGFYALQNGYQKAEILNVDAPFTVTFNGNWLDLDSATVKHLMTVNDDSSMNETDREDEITYVFSQHGVEVDFV